ncbi:Aspartate-semialdehyde dehydrogenase [Neochlamydia sp. AcF65]|uniref:aspartate-semialdehyde dehydrogenase n=1 Tax=Neochlamydia sp. AcF65 TaxID=2795735 RepID=UPI001BC933FB|nr:aspartate-semialdehyde dehydrogenase [Neochlamydia sp. AcF65]MBS4166552.1 Aspartate-semialdehyde dehydrogenase [Neochlamydia sp. AcF65]
MKKIPVGILGATGMVGQQYLQLLSKHPWFEVVFLASSKQSAGKSYAEAVQNRWLPNTPLSETHGKLPVYSIENIEQCKRDCSLVFSAVDSPIAKLYEESYAVAGLPVMSNASYHRNTPDVPILIPEINAHHLSMIRKQQKNRGWGQGCIVVKPNCSLQSYMIPLQPLHQKFQVKKLMVTTLQAVSGAGYPGVPSYAIQDNIIPYIEGEEQKSESEPLKIWGNIQEDKIVNALGISLSITCNRVPVLDGHMACVAVEFATKPSLEDILQAWQAFKGAPQELHLPSAPLCPLVYHDEKDRPQPRLDRLEGNGMSVVVGRLRECPLFHYRFTALSHNTIRGAAGGGILTAELIYQQGYIRS